jgi:hypothetical protein
MNDVLPPDVLQGALRQGNEYGWRVSSFPDALASAAAHGYGCLGGQFQFRLDDGGTCEMYWLAADSRERADGEHWGDYSHRSCSEVLTKFQHLVSVTDFAKEAQNWRFQIDSAKSLVFVAYFVTESELAELRKSVGR